MIIALYTVIYIYVYIYLGNRSLLRGHSTAASPEIFGNEYPGSIIVNKERFAYVITPHRSDDRLRIQSVTKPAKKHMVLLAVMYKM